MSDTLHKVLIVGGNSAIGSALGHYLEARGVEVLTTTRRDNPGPNQIRLDLSEDPAKWPELPQVDRAVIAAAVTALDDCHTDPVSSRAINVDGAGEVAQRLVANDAFVLHFSTNQVFDGTLAHRTEEDAPCPVSEYGRQKSDSESQVLAKGDGTAILRLSKVLTNGLPVINRWRKAWSQGDVAKAFNDMTLAPLPVNLVCELAIRILDAQAPGIFHASGASDLTYFELAQRTAERLGVTPDRVIPTSVRNAPVLPEAAPINTTLAMTRATTEFGISPPTTWAAVDAILANIGSTADGRGSEPAYQESTDEDSNDFPDLAAPRRAAVA
jgi:dTDP-4-dehydrorhamnose reductase